MYQIKEQLELLSRPGSQEPAKVFAHRFGDIDVCAAANPRFAPTAAFFWELLEGVRGGGVDFLRDGYKLQLGWNLLFFERMEGFFQITVPNYTGDVLGARRRDITLALIVQFWQSHYRLVCGLPQEVCEVSFQDTILVHKSALGGRDYYLHHAYPAEEGASGWFLGLLDVDADNSPKNLHRVRTCELVRHQANALGLLPLPLGYMAVIQDGQVADIRDAGDNVVYSR